MVLEDEVYDKIQEYCENGDEYVNAYDFDKAIEEYKKALDILPEPKTDWEASTWVYCALGDVYYLKDEYDLALDYLFEVLKCPDGLGNPFVSLRIGQCFYEKNNFDKAKEFLLQAYMMEGTDIFADEDEKYYNCIEKLV